MKKILYAEDNAGMRKMVSHYLSSIGFEIFAVTDGDEAIVCAKEVEFDLILLDVTMERIDGTEAARQIRSSNNNNSSKPILGLTGRTEDNEVQECLNSGMDIVLSKPVDLDALAQTIQNILFVSNENDMDKEDKPISGIQEPEDNSHKIIDLKVLETYKNSTSASAVEGLLQDFSNLWLRKIGVLYSATIKQDLNLYIHTAQELSAISSGIGASKVVAICSKAIQQSNIQNCFLTLEEIVRACDEVQNIINGISKLEKSQVEHLVPKVIKTNEADNSNNFEEDFPILRHLAS